MPHDQLLMEALMLFSSEESDSSVVSEDSDIEAKTDASRSVQLAAEDKLWDDEDDDSFLESAVAEVLLMSLDQRDGNEATTQPMLAKRKIEEFLHSSTQATPRYGRKRSKKCTYAARRLEASHLRSLALELENQLEHLQNQHGQQDQHKTLHLLRFERQQLAISQAENTRLRKQIEAAEVHVRQLQAAMNPGLPPFPAQ